MSQATVPTEANIAVRVRGQEQPVYFTDFTALTAWAIACARANGEAVDSTPVGTPNARGGRDYRFDPNAETFPAFCWRCEGTGTYRQHGECFNCKGVGGMWIRHDAAIDRSARPAPTHILERLLVQRPQMRELFPGELPGMEPSTPGMTNAARQIRRRNNLEG